jgi:hypothetical protein
MVSRMVAGVVAALLTVSVCGTAEDVANTVRRRA